MELLTNQYAVFFLIIALGLILGNIKIKGISLESSGVIFIALVFGHFGFKTPEFLQNLGLILFIYSVGIAAGPGFFKSFKEQGMKYFWLAGIIVVSAASLSFVYAKVTGTDIRLMTGIFTGALTSTPGLAAAIEATHSPLASIGYGIAYPFGVIGIIIFVRIIDKVVKVDLKASEKEYSNSLKKENPQIFNKNFIVSNPNVFGKTIGELKVRTMTNTNISRVFHDSAAIAPNSLTKIFSGDIIKAVGSEEGLEKIGLLIGEETDIKIPLNADYTVKSILVTNILISNKSFSDINLFENYDATATCIRRAGIDITPKASTRIQLGDKVMIACPKNSLKDIESIFGHKGKAIQLDLLPISLGIIAGVLIGQIKIPLFGISLSLGVTGGVLFASLLLSKIGRTGPLVWNTSGDVNQFLRKIGLVFFLVGVGTNAGGSLYSTLLSNGILLVLVGISVTMLTMIIALLFGKYIFKMNFLLFLGALTGGMTSTPALSALDSMTDSESVKIGYATIYPFALVFKIICVKLLCLF